MQQVDLFNLKKPSSPPPPLDIPKEVKPTSTIATTLEQYKNHLVVNGKSMHTIGGFISDILLLKAYIGNKPLNGISTPDLKNFLGYRAVTKKDKPKTIERRIATLKNYFTWLYEDKILPYNIALSLPYNRPTVPLPKILNTEESKRFIDEASKDPRDYILTVLLLEKGVKRKELLAIKLEDVNFNNAYRPEITINPQDRKRERVIVLTKGFIEAYNEYVEKYEPKEFLFELTERQINNILKMIAERAGVKKEVSCQILRDTCVALRIRGGESPENVLQDIGLVLSSVREETLGKYIKLASKV